MWPAIGATFGFCCLIWAVVHYAKKSARNSAQLDAIKADLERTEKERKRANQVTDSVRNMRDDDVRRRLQDRTSK